MIPTLTERQKSVLSMVAEDRSVPEIAAYLYLTSGEVSRILTDCLTRLGGDTLAEAVESALQLRLIGTGGVVA